MTAERLFPERAHSHFCRSSLKCSISQTTFWLWKIVLWCPTDRCQHKKIVTEKSPSSAQPAIIKRIAVSLSVETKQAIAAELSPHLFASKKCFAIAQLQKWWRYLSHQYLSVPLQPLNSTTSSEGPTTDRNPAKECTWSHNTSQSLGCQLFGEQCDVAYTTTVTAVPGINRRLLSSLFSTQSFS